MYLIGIDGGGTSTQGTISNMDLMTIATYEVGATNYHTVGIDLAKSRLHELISTLVQRAEITLNQVAGICMGGAGVDCKQDQEAIEGLFKSIGFQNDLVIVNDAYTALVGGNKGINGAIVICGTGSISMGIANGKVIRVGGWGHLIDDEGSGYAIGNRAMRAILRSYDLRGDQTILKDQVLTHLGLDHPEDLIAFLYGPKTSKDQIAALAPIVLEASQTDSVARQITQEGIEGLYEMIASLYLQMGNKPLSITVGGSLLVKSSTYRELLKKRLESSSMSIDLHLPKEGPVFGALTIIQNKCLEREGRV